MNFNKLNMFSHIIIIFWQGFALHQWRFFVAHRDAQACIHRPKNEGEKQSKNVISVAYHRHTITCSCTQRSNYISQRWLHGNRRGHWRYGYGPVRLSRFCGRHLHTCFTLSSLTLLSPAALAESWVVEVDGATSGLPLLSPRSRESKKCRQCC